MPRVNPSVLLWARETSGLSVDEAAQKLGLADSRRATAAEKLIALESGKREPTRPLILKMAKQYRRPLVAFYLAEIPSQGDRGHDFRRLPDGSGRESVELVDALVRDIQARQEAVKAVLLDDDSPPLQFVGSVALKDGRSAVMESISAQLEFDLEDFRSQRNPEGAFTFLREKVEQAGVFVLLVGNLGSHHTAISCEAFRGFALADPVAPFIVVNDQDAKAAWSFTLIHELAHIWLGQTGVSGAPKYDDSAVEKFCNDVASEILLPARDLDTLPIVGESIDQLEAAIEGFARPRNVSYSMVAYRLFLAGRVSRQDWEELRQRFRAMWFRQRARARQLARENDDSGPSYYIVKRHKLGNALLRLIRQKLDDGELTPSKAAMILGVKPRTVQPLVKIEVASSRGGSH